MQYPALHSTIGRFTWWILIVFGFVWLRPDTEHEKIQEKTSIKIDKEILRKAETGDAQAQFKIGRMYQLGLGGLKKDAQAAIQWYHKAAKQGHANAQYNLGVMYDNGERVKKDPQAAIQWYRKAAEQGHVSAKKLLKSLR